MSRSMAGWHGVLLAILLLAAAGMGGCGDAGDQTEAADATKTGSLKTDPTAKMNAVLDPCISLIKLPGDRSDPCASSLPPGEGDGNREAAAEMEELADQDESAAEAEPEAAIEAEAEPDPDPAEAADLSAETPEGAGEADPDAGANPAKPVPAVFIDLARSAAGDLNAALWQTLDQLRARVDKIRVYPYLRNDVSLTIWELPQPLNPGEPGIPRFSIQVAANGALDTGATIYQERLAADSADEGIWEAKIPRIWTVNFNELDPARWAGHGKGSVTVDFTAWAQKQVNPALYKKRGKITMQFSALASDSRVLQFTYDGFTPENTDAAATQYWVTRYTSRPDGSGEFQFTTDMNWLRTTETLEHFDVTIKWKGDGAGQSQAFITGQDIRASNLAMIEWRECWDPAFLRTFSNQLNYVVDPNSGQPVIPDPDPDFVNHCPYAFSPPKWNTGGGDTDDDQAEQGDGAGEKEPEPDAL